MTSLRLLLALSSKCDAEGKPRTVGKGTNDDMTLFHRQDPAAALGLLTRLPIQIDTELAVERGAKASWAYPLAGAVVGAIAAVTAGIALWLGLPATVAAALALAVQIVITGAMHEDGLADSADGLWGGWTIDRRLEIMKDSRIGAYGVLALGLALILRWSALAAILPYAGWFWLPVVGALSRAPMPALMAALPNARANGLSQSVGRPSQETMLAGVAIAVVVALIGVGWAAFACIFWAGVVATGCAMIAKAKIGGQTGDILGATQQVTEIAVLCVLAAQV